MNSNLFVACFRCTTTRYRPTTVPQQRAPACEPLKPGADAGGQGEHRCQVVGCTGAAAEGSECGCGCVAALAAARGEGQNRGRNATRRNAIRHDKAHGKAHDTHTRPCLLASWSLCRCERASVTRDRPEAWWLVPCPTWRASICLSVACRATIKACSSSSSQPGVTGHSLQYNLT